ncbi:NAD(P)-binding protein [Trametopsis cervina]|nr:NAD(P)-binding protein [Trametopsis cervina]
MSTSPRVWLITGTSSGFGRTVAEFVLSKGDKVVATLRKPEALKDLQDSTPAGQLLVLKVDVTKPEDIVSAFASAKETFGRVDVVFNNAGYGMRSICEGTPDHVARAIFETNFWGSANVSKEAVRFLRDENPAGSGGRIILTSSYASATGFPTMSWYSATKHAIDAVHESLSEEVDPSWNIKITMLQPGVFRTSAVESRVIVPPPDIYLNPKPTAGIVKMDELLGYMTQPGAKLGDVKKAADRIYKLSTMPDPPLRLPLGDDAVHQLRLQLGKMLAEVNKYAEWAEGLVEA